MHEIINFLKNAVDKDANAGVYGCYMFRETGVYAYNRIMLAGVTIPYATTYNIPAAPLDAALARMKSIDSITMDDNSVTLKSSRPKLRSTIKIDLTEAIEVPEMPAEENWSECPPGLFEALNVAKNFCGDQNWQVCIRIWNDKVTAFHPQRGIEITVKGLNLESPALITQETADFIIDHQPDEMSLGDSNIFFRWDDGRWMRAQTYNGTMPEAIVRKIIDAAGNDTPIDIDVGFKTAFADVAAMCDKAFSISAQGFTGRTGEDPSHPTGESAVEYELPLPPEHTSIWTKEIIEPIFKYASAFNPLSWPDACLFVGPNMRGVVVGRNKW